ncbi:MAG: DUF4293 domain-containing protein [Paludibacteraceae bacterium]|nr:DUF4293 domain-containing protein [Paludibacteraceae bacterium]
MIQRIQSLYLLVVSVLFAVLAFTPLADFSVAGKDVVITDGRLLTCYYLLISFAIVIAALAFVSVFFYKKRMLQVKLTILNLVLILATYPLMAVYLFIAHSSDLDFHLNLVVLFPLISAILSYLAIRAIKKDEELVRSVNRIR